MGGSNSKAAGSPKKSSKGSKQGMAPATPIKAAEVPEEAEEGAVAVVVANPEAPETNGNKAADSGDVLVAVADTQESAAVPSIPRSDTATSVVQRAPSAKLFAAPEGPKKSKIFQALNPDKLWYESRREKEESKDETNHVVIRGGGAGFTRSSVDFAVERDDEGNLVADHLEGVVHEEEEEDFDPNNLPGFGEMEEEMKVLRAERAVKHAAHQEELRKRYMEKKRREDEERQAELKAIAEREARLKKERGEDYTDDFVRAAQQRMEEEAQKNFNTFSFRK